MGVAEHQMEHLEEQGDSPPKIGAEHHVGIKVLRSESSRKRGWMVLEIFVGFASTLGQVFLKFFDPLPSPRILAISNSSQERLRGRHTLVRTPEGVLSCTACYLCQTGCPADCIHIEVDPVSAPASHLRPSVFTIDELKCIQCGLCVEACPYDAIRMDTGKFAPPLLPEDIVRSRRYDLLAVVSEMNELKS